MGWPAAARQAERLTAVVVFPTPPFWLATAMIRAKANPPDSENLAKHDFGCKMFHVEQLEAVEKLGNRPKATWTNCCASVVPRGTLVDVPAGPHRSRFILYACRDSSAAGPAVSRQEARPRKDREFVDVQPKIGPKRSTWNTRQWGKAEGRTARREDERSE